MSFIPRELPKQYKLFDKLAEHMYYGAKFRNMLAENPQAMAAMETLVDALENSRAKHVEVKPGLSCECCQH